MHSLRISFKSTDLPRIQDTRDMSVAEEIWGRIESLVRDAEINPNDGAMAITILRQYTGYVPNC